MSGENRDPQSEPGIGRSLEKARKDRGLSLWQAEQETRIRSRYLRDLEREDFDVLPAVYVLGSLKTYADFLGLDGAALSRQLKASLIEPDEPDVAAQVAAIGGARDEEDEYEAAPVPAVGFDQLFLGMGVILISILAIMTIAAAVAQGDRSPVSQVDQPSTPEPPSEIALAGNVRDEGDGTGTSVDEGEGQGNGPEASKNDESKNDRQGEDQGEKEDQDAPQATSLFGDAEFVPMSSPSPSTAASASASPAPSTAKLDASPVPTAPASAAPAPRATSEPASDYPSAASAPSDASAPAPATTPAPAPASADPQGGGGGPSPQGPAPGSGPVSSDVDRMIDEVFRENGLD